MAHSQFYGGPAPLVDRDGTGSWVEFPFSASMTLAEVAAEIGKTPRAVELAISKLVKEGKLKYVGPQKGAHWEVLI